tara:strand:- start:301 stop:591 length:291 start_codon:yes stop_codon:yes gene_type:complete
MSDIGTDPEAFELVMDSDWQPNNILIYDINAIPNECTGWDMEKIVYLFKQRGILFYDGDNGEKPEVKNVKDIDVRFVDVSREENQKILNNYKFVIK